MLDSSLLKLFLISSIYCNSWRHSCWCESTPNPSQSLTWSIIFLLSLKKMKKISQKKNFLVHSQFCNSSLLGTSCSGTVTHCSQQLHLRWLCLKCKTQLLKGLQRAAHPPYSWFHWSEKSKPSSRKANPKSLYVQSDTEQSEHICYCHVFNNARKMLSCHGWLLTPTFN